METKSVNYQFAHRLLPDYVQEENRLLNRFFMTEELPNAFSIYMNVLYESCCGPEQYKAAKEKNFEESVFEITEEKFSEHISLVIIKMPEPKEWAEPKYLLFAFAIGDELFTYNSLSRVCKSRIRYFVYELGEDKGEEVYYVCEWAKNGNHLNYNYLPEPSLENFVNRVKEILDENLSAGVGVDAAAALFEYGYACFEKKEYEAAIEHFTKLIELGDKENGYFWRGRANLENGNYDAAVKDLKLSLEDNNYFAPAVVEEITKAMELKGEEDAEYYLFRGIAYYDSGNFDDAIKDFTKAIELRGDADDYHWRGCAYEENKNNYDAAIKDFTKAMELRDKENIDDYVWRGNSYFGNRNYDAAIKDFTKAIELKDKENFHNYYCYHYRGEAYLENGNYDAAIQDLTKAIDLGIPEDELYKANFDDYFLRGKAYFGKGNSEAAKRDLYKATEITPEFEETERYKEFKELLSNAVGDKS